VSIIDNDPQINPDDLILDSDDDSILDSLLDDTQAQIELDAQDVQAQMEDNIIALSQHSLQNKHTLKHDSIFKGKKEVYSEEDAICEYYRPETYDIDEGSNSWSESMDNENYIRAKFLEEKIHHILTTETEINLKSERRNPGKAVFNGYYSLVVDRLSLDGYSHTEIFNSLSVYFSENLFNMYKLLHNKWRMLIYKELENHIGTTKRSDAVQRKNLDVGSEIEFIHHTESSTMRIAGVIIQENHEECDYVVNSYQKIYHVDLEDIVRIIDNTKFRFNLDKLNYVDFI
jgi:hypothetical protein